jgi:peptidoglycan L-alanyl-D-glutamate endopeptidase CwlK
MNDTRRLQDFMSAGARAFVGSSGRSVALAAAAAAGMTFASVAPASAVPVPTLRAEALVEAPAPAPIKATQLYTAIQALDAFRQSAMTPIPGSDSLQATISVRQAFALEMRRASEALSDAKPLPAGTVAERGAAAGLGKVSLKMMEKLHPDMQELLVRARAASSIPFEIVPTYGGKRTAGMQALLKKRGVTKTLMSKHILGLAFDIAPKTPNGRLDFKDEAKLKDLSEIVVAQAEEMGLPVTWGGGWKFVDMFHFELPADWEAVRDDVLTAALSTTAPANDGP